MNEMPSMRNQLINDWVRGELARGPVSHLHLLTAGARSGHSAPEVRLALQAIGARRAGTDWAGPATTQTLPSFKLPPVLSQPAESAAKIAERDPRRAAVEAAAGDPVRCRAIIGCVEAEGRERLAAHFAFESAISVREARSALAAAALDPGSRPAIALAEDAVARRILSAGRAASRRGVQRRDP